MDRRKKVIMLVVMCISLLFIQSAMAESDQAKPGDVITSENCEKIKGSVPDPIFKWVRDEGYRMKIVAGKDFPIPECFAKATEKYGGQARLTEGGGLENYVAGLPFPDPQEPNLGLKIMWNYERGPSKADDWDQLSYLSWANKKDFERDAEIAEKVLYFHGREYLAKTDEDYTLTPNPKA